MNADQEMRARCIDAAARVVSAILLSEGDIKSETAIDAMTIAFANSLVDYVANGALPIESQGKK